jgi:threonine dehydratase
MSYAISMSDVSAASSRIGSYVHRTPVLKCSALSAAASSALGVRVELAFKCELFQRTGSFKMRGATNAVFSLSESSASHGVCTHSSGNHAAALAAAAAARGGCTATIVMPTDAPALKVAATAGYGAKIVTCAPGSAARAAAAAEVASRTGATFVHPSENPFVIAGQGTVALEFLAQAGDVLGAPAENQPVLDVIVVPVGGGGLISGCAVAVRGTDSRVRVVGAEPSGAGGDGADAARSFLAKQLCTHSDAGAPPLDTCADGLRTSLGPNTWPIVRDFVSAVVPVSESAVARALRDVWERAKLAIEPSAAVGVAALLQPSTAFREALGPELLSLQRPLRIGVILCGGNADIGAIASLIAGVPRELDGDGVHAR